MASKPSEAGGDAWDRVSLTASEGTNPANSLTLDFRPLHCGRINFCCLTTQFVVLCYGSPRTLIQALAHFPDGDTEAQLVGGDSREQAGLGSPPGAV